MTRNQMKANETSRRKQRNGFHTVHKIRIRSSRMFFAEDCISSLYYPYRHQMKRTYIDEARNSAPTTKAMLIQNDASCTRDEKSSSKNIQQDHNTDLYTFCIHLH